MMEWLDTLARVCLWSALVCVACALWISFVWWRIHRALRRFMKGPPAERHFGSPGPVRTE